MPLHVDRHGRVALLTLDEPERRNALTAPLVAEIVAAMDDLDADPGVGAIVVTGAPPAFCSGADVQALAAMAAGTEEPNDVRAIYAGFLRVLDSPLPTIAAVNGAAVGAGCNLALACDLRLAGAERGLRRSVPAHRDPSRRWPHLAPRPRRGTPDHRGHGPLR